MNWLILIAEALACSATLYLAHEFPLNSKVIEPHMAKGSRIAYVGGLLYYAVFLLIPIYVFHKIQ